ncbi:LytTR family DNA-binding domain-containing protein [uncultured Kordia sp.]|uniref:LytR/AlgR family response regulator transcription factor n=1 Tax=uncultured Kordia sp. TaxID=507699 RepID=UPI00261B8275|nr:LytTR family DNA-binding domain-containing protein [uncultured Kordia sp.]
MKSLIIEDEEYIRKGLVNLLDKVGSNVQVIGECGSIKEAVILTKACKPELIFLDINLIDGTAFDFLEQSTYKDFKIIFITAFEEYALKAFRLGAIDYLLKPIDIEELRTALQKVEKLPLQQQKQQLNIVKQALAHKKDKLILSLEDSFQVVHLDQLMFCESDKGYTTFYCSDGKKYMVSKILKEFEEQLSNTEFIRPHQSFIVNLNFIDKYDKSGVIYLENGKKIPVSLRKRESFLAAFLNKK